MAITLYGDLDWTGSLTLFLEPLDGGPVADPAGYAFSAVSGQLLQRSAVVPEPILPANRLVGLYRASCSVGVFYASIVADANTVYMNSDKPAATTANVWTQEQVDYAISQLGLLTLSGSTVVIPSGELMCTRGDVEQVFGTVSVATWADLNNTGDADDIAARINYRIAMADNYVRSVLASGPWNMPEPGDIIPAILAYNVAALTGVYLYEARGIQDYNAAGHAQHQLSYHKKNVEDFLKGVLVGTINLKPLTYSITSAAPEAS